MPNANSYTKTHISQPTRASNDHPTHSSNPAPTTNPTTNPTTSLTCLITGAAKGIGQNLAATLADKGANLILIDIEPIELHSLNITSYQADLTNKKEIVKITETIRQNHPPLDILINNAGIGIYKSLPDLTPEEWQTSIDINLTAPYLLTKLLLPSLQKAQNPLVLNIGSGCGKKGVAGRAAYCATKFGLRGLSLSLHQELKPHIKVVHLALGSVATHFGPLSAEEKLNSTGKNYLSTQEVSEKVLEIIEKAQIQEGYNPDEVELYPEGYYEALENSSLGSTS